jgi:hypothetical protein
MKMNILTDQSGKVEIEFVDALVIILCVLSVIAMVKIFGNTNTSLKTSNNETVTYDTETVIIDNAENIIIRNAENIKIADE